MIVAICGVIVGVCGVGVLGFGAVILMEGRKQQAYLSQVGRRKPKA